MKAICSLASILLLATSALDYSMDGEYGPAATDVRHRVSLTGTVTAKWGIRFNPLLTVNSGPPFDITAGHDLYGDTLFNGRPGIAPSAAIPGVVATSCGLLDPNPTPGERLLPRNFGRGPGQIMFDVRVGRTFAFGPSREGAAAAAAARSDHWEHHVASVWPGEPACRSWRRHLLGIRQQSAPRTADAFDLLTPNSCGHAAHRERRCLAGSVY
jgi:hypothetical protein